jgi:purine-binding chemotaxis protein CheW
MAARGSKKGNDNFEKMKKEMSTKKQKVKKKGDSEISLTNINNNDSEITIDDNAIISEKVVKTKKKTKIKNEDLTAEKMEVKMVIFRIAKEEFAFEISNVKEIIRLPLLTKVPNAPDFITGICNLRGELLPVIDSRKLFSMAAEEYNEGSRIVVTDIQGKKVGLIVDRVSEVISVEQSIINEPPVSIKGIDGGVISSILLLDEGKRVIMVLDAPKLVNIENFEEYSNHQNIRNITKQVSDKLSSEEEQAIIFNIGKEEYAFKVNDVKEIIRVPDIMKVPNTPDYVEGVLSLRNQLLTVINLGRLLNVDFRKLDEQCRIIIIDNGNILFGVIVDRVSQVIKIHKDSFRMTNQSTVVSQMDYIKGFLELNNGTRLVMLLNTHKLISNEDVNNIVSLDRSKKKNNGILVADDESNLEHIIIFKLGNSEYGVRINHVKEINRISDMMHFPGAPAFIDGMVNLRGEVIPLLNIKKMFNDDSSLSDSSKYLVVEYDYKRIGISIDAVSEVLRFPASNLEKLSEVFDDNAKNKYIDAAAKLNEGKRIVLLLNLSVILNFM